MLHQHFLKMMLRYMHAGSRNASKHVIFDPLLKQRLQSNVVMSIVIFMMTFHYLWWINAAWPYFLTLFSAFVTMVSWDASTNTTTKPFDTLSNYFFYQYSAIPGALPPWHGKRLIFRYTIRIYLPGVKFPILPPWERGEEKKWCIVFS